MKYSARIGLLMSIVLSPGCATSNWSAEAECLTVDAALERVASTGQVDVSVCGVLRYRSEDRNLYSSEEAAAGHSRRQCISVGEADGLNVNLESLDGTRVVLKGIARSNFCPAGTLCLGSCSDTGIFVRSVEIEPDRGL